MKFRRFAPDSILGWLALILIAGLAASQALTALAHNMDRNEAIVEIEDLRAAERVATFATFLQHTAPVLRASVAQSFSGPSMTVEVTNRANVPEDEESNRRLGHLAKAVSERLRGTGWQEIRVAEAAPTDEQKAKGLMPIRTSIALRDGAWINFEFAAIESLPLATIRVIAWTAFSVLLVLGLSYYAFRRVTHPLEQLTRAAESLGRSGRTEALQETGASEVRRAARAFNEMQGRIRRLLEDRMQMVAAISHDLRTPITRLKLRAEFVEDPEQREKMLRDLDEMETMIKETLALAREDANPERRAKLDLGQLLIDSVEGMEHVTLEIDPALQGASIEAQPIALKRAIVNLVENAVVYGKSARIRLTAAEDFEIGIMDQGPGIPEAELDRVFRPFYRLEASRNRESGGAGLGLAIARSVVRAHGGDIVLKNGPEGGLQATVTLPK
ncbi:ATP-binding protein [Dongia sp.]|uniref:ATP-binding protein n=1 Tax=Dongia sp. TaxID=1977262 RepID=UPI0037523AB7